MRDLGTAVRPLLLGLARFRVPADRRRPLGRIVLLQHLLTQARIRFGGNARACRGLGADIRAGSSRVQAPEVCRFRGRGCFLGCVCHAGSMEPRGEGLMTVR
jgi:hypothetical protein